VWMLLTQFRWIAGSVSGGCLEGDIAYKGWWRTRGGEPVLVTYDSSVPDGADDDDVRAAFGLGCDGVVEVLLERAGGPGRLDALELADECARTQRRAVVVTVFRSTDPAVRIGTRIALGTGGEPREETREAPLDDALRAAMIDDARTALEAGASCNRSYATARGQLETFIEVVLPPPRLFVLGTGHDAVPVVQLARAVGWDVTIGARRSRVTTRERFRLADEVLIGTPAELAARIDVCDRALAIVMSHDYEHDRELLGMLLATRTQYIGVLGPRTRTQRMLGELAPAAQDDPRLHAPVGLELGAETPQEIALAIVAEIQSVLRRAPAGSLRDRVGPIHDQLVAFAI